MKKSNSPAPGFPPGRFADVFANLVLEARRSAPALVNDYPRVEVQ